MVKKQKKSLVGAVGINVQLNQEARALIESIRQESGVSIVEMIRRVVEWFATQDPRIRAAILSRNAVVRNGLTRLVLEEMQSHPTKDFDNSEPTLSALHLTRNGRVEIIPVQEPNKRPVKRELPDG